MARDQGTSKAKALNWQEEYKRILVETHKAQAESIAKMEEGLVKCGMRIHENHSKAVVTGEVTVLNDECPCPLALLSRLQTE